MPFTVSPSEVQAMQEDEAQLLNAIAQTAQRATSILRLGNPRNDTSRDHNSTLRIKMGRRLVYGNLADGPFRHELDANSLKVIADALQRPADPNADLEKYARKIPAIEIFQDDVLLFREERDGTVTTNEIQLQIEQGSQTERSSEIKQGLPTQSTAASNEIAASDSTVSENSPKANPPKPLLKPKQKFTVNRADHISRTAQHLINPLSQEKGFYDAVSVAGYQIKQNGKDITVGKDNQQVLSVRDGEVISKQISPQDWKTLGQLQVPNELSEPYASVSKGLEILGDAEITVEMPGEDPGENIGQNHQTISVLERETQKLPNGPTHRLLQVTIRDWKQQSQQWIARQLHKGAEWIRTQQSESFKQDMALATKTLFKRGYERTGEHSYQVKGCTITREGASLYILSDGAGELMKFKAANSIGLGRQVAVLSVSDRFTHQHAQALLSAQADRTVIPQGSLDNETTYARKSRQAENTTRQFLRDFAFSNSWSKEGGRFKLEVNSGDLLRITDKQDGRGVVFQRENGAVFSRLNNQDFVYFEQLSAKMQRSLARDNPVKNSSAEKTTPKKASSKRTGAIEID